MLQGNHVHNVCGWRCGKLTSAEAPSTKIMDMVSPYAAGFALWKAESPEQVYDVAALQSQAQVHLARRAPPLQLPRLLRVDDGDHEAHDL